MRINASVVPSEYFYTLHQLGLAWERGRELGVPRPGPAPAWPHPGHQYGVRALDHAMRFIRIRSLRGETHEPVHAVALAS